jgi:hypothetical protein
MQDYLAQGWGELLAHNGLKGFDALWALEADWFEPPNERRGGWSGVVRLGLKRPDGTVEGVFLKRQENHLRRTLQHPLSGEPTFAGEMQNILRLQEAGVPTLEPLYYGQRQVDGRWRAILVTRELVGFKPLDWWMHQWREAGWHLNRPIRLAVIHEAARVVRRLHAGGLVHNSLHPKHLFVRVSKGDDGLPLAEVRLIDLEKMRRAFSPLRAARRDLDSLNRRCQPYSRSDRLRFLRAYLGESVLSPKGRDLWRRLSDSMLNFRKEHGIGG